MYLGSLLEKTQCRVCSRYPLATAYDAITSHSPHIQHFSFTYPAHMIDSSFTETTEFIME
jgi:hypothetical protein